jgi:HD-GYP domain-containing protein (c-di-GMP phosphodiesterase class II)
MTSPDEKLIKEKQAEGIIEVNFLKPGYRFEFDLFDEDNNLILKAHAPISEGVLNHLKSSGMGRLFFDPLKAKQAGEIAKKSVISNELKNETYHHTKNMLEEIRHTFNHSPGESIGKGTIDKSRDLVSRIISETDNNDDGIFEVTEKLKDMDDFYYHHSMNVAIMASMLGSRLDFKPDMKSAMGVGGLFHDIGFSSVSKDILYKAQLSDEEFDIIKEHTHVGYKFVEKNKNLHDIEKRMLLLHHERADGEGYPYGFDMDHYQNNVPREVRLLGLVDFFVTLIMPKPGEPAMTPREAIRFMVNKIYAEYKTIYSFLQPDLRDFIRALGFVINKGEHFMARGDLVRISTGEIGLIEEMNRLYPLNPKVRIVKNSKMENLKRPITVDLIKTYKDYVSNIYDRNSSGGFSISKNSSAGRV